MTNTELSKNTIELGRAVADQVKSEIVPAVEAAVERAMGRRGDPDPEFISINDSLRILRVSRTQLYRLFAEGALTPIKRGRSTLLHRDDVKRFVEKLRSVARDRRRR